MTSENEPLLERRTLLKALSAAATTAWMANEPTLVSAKPDSKIEHPAPKADACILLWMAGGMAAPETFDPKRYVPYEKGLEVSKMLSTFPAIDTVVDDLKICAGLENIAKVLDRGTLIRSAVQPDLGSILHSRHQYHWHTGYVPPQTVAAPILDLDGKSSRASKSSYPSLHQHWPTLGGGGRKRRVEGVHNSRIFWKRVRPHESSISRSSRSIRSPTQRNGSQSIYQSKPSISKAYRSKSSPRVHEQSPTTVAAAEHGKRLSVVELKRARCI